MGFIMEFAENMILRMMEDPDKRDQVRREHVYRMKERSQSQITDASPCGLMEQKSASYPNQKASRHHEIFLPQVSPARATGRRRRHGASAKTGHIVPDPDGDPSLATKTLEPGPARKVPR
ncbi:uncharacterized protein C2845_PM02G02320 [Panicum miliaceum]|uniref:Uncharacterized protein n=1 Tax=Panicum miliaceum TaxID=4540 RepID=A0A3L6SJG4_PANMI|nr:uncharacterized protein C2845_PM02G02320 [Panicum miliaceum]